MSVFETIAIQIIRGQEFVIGPLAWSEAQKVPGIVVDTVQGRVTLSGDGKAVVNLLVAQYERLFGHASHEVCIDAATASIKNLPPSDIPTSLLTEHD